VKYEADGTRIVWFCGCKQTAGAPLCDGTHKQC
jgi:CDGSH-type Zn-finger protein